jgi:alanyl-tRNA synthetase
VAVNDGRASVAIGVTVGLAGQRSAVDLVRRAVEREGGGSRGGGARGAGGGGGLRRVLI